MSEQLASLANLQSEFSKASAGAPASYWIAIANNFGAGTTGIVVPQSGKLWIYYGIGTAPAAEISVWHQGGTKTPIKPGENYISVGQGDLIYYRLNNPSTDSIKVGYQYV